MKLLHTETQSLVQSRNQVAEAGEPYRRFYRGTVIGNRETATNNGSATSYSANDLNQYGEISTSTVTNSPTYDADGNMLTNGDWTYTWNGENRLVGASNSSHVITYSYDYKGRCFEKVKDSDAVDYIWDGYNIISEISNSQTNYNIWGLDLSGSMQGAGGVGGLLAVVQDGDTYFTAYDANGNITSYSDTNGTIVAGRVYSPFGKTISLTGSKQDDFTHWFSTKPWDADTGMSEYELRKYLVELGRWGSRDPINEVGFHNLSGLYEGDKSQLLLRLQEIVAELEVEDSEVSALLRISITNDDELMVLLRRTTEQNMYMNVDNSPLNLFDWLGLMTKTERALKRCHLVYSVAKYTCTVRYVSMNPCLILKYPACMERARGKYYQCVIDALDA